GLGDHERQVALETVCEPRATVLERVSERAEVNPDVAVAQLDREHAQVVRPLVERAPGGYVEPGVMPVAGQDSARQGAAMKREAHVRTAVVDSTNVATVGEEDEGVPADLRDKRTEPAHLVG